MNLASLSYANIINLAWVIPGVVGLWAYNRWLLITRPQAEGWAYLFSVVVFALPSYYVFEILSVSASFKCFSTTAECSFTLLSAELLLSMSIALLSVLFAGLLGYCVARVINIGKSSLDPFHECCYLWEREVIYITLKNNKVYMGILLDYTKDLRFESTIRIVAIYSGYRDENRKVHWTFNYPAEYLSKSASKIGTIISQKEIMTFSLWDDSITNIADIRARRDDSITNTSDIRS